MIFKIILWVVIGLVVLKLLPKITLCLESVLDYLTDCISKFFKFLVNLIKNTWKRIYACPWYYKLPVALISAYVLAYFNLTYPLIIVGVLSLFFVSLWLYDVMCYLSEKTLKGLFWVIEKIVKAFIFVYYKTKRQSK